MPGLSSPQNQAGIMNFYDAQTSGPKLNPKIVLAIVVIFAVTVIMINHFIFYP
jgi:preprotein translocase subunit Sec61beta